ncbi:uncharacterized protein LOC117344391 [Pecten maximus]|uniref:uncharacterized protein LOC117344391 n=1 Tax=Pecten maximus TaxID=6579 RepID=UPI001457F50F|nr:uncharacterized protein LOC117344391 [Pecten maximus]
MSFFQQALSLFLLICVIFSSSNSSEFLDKRNKRDWSLEGMIQNLLDSIDGDVATTKDVSNITAPANSTVNTTTSPSTSSTTPFVTLSSSITSTTKSVNSNSTSASSTSTFSSTTTPWTTTTDDPQCKSDQTLETVCNVPEVLIGENFWDIYYVMFSDDVIRALLFGCSSGHWCLEDKSFFWNALMMERSERVLKSPLFKGVCESESLTCLHDFVGNHTECKLYQRMQLTMQSIDLLCQLQKEPTTTLECVQHVLAALHVTVVDILRDQNQKEDDEDDGNSCTSPESQITRTFLCLEFKCPGNILLLTSFQPWKWFVGDVMDISARCGYRNDVCQDDTNFTSSTGAKSSGGSSSLSSQSSVTSTGTWTGFSHLTGTEPFDQNESGSALEHTHEDEDDWEHAYGVNMLMGMAVTSLLLLSVMLIGFFIWWRKLLRNRVVKAGYTQLKCDEA